MTKRTEWPIVDGVPLVVSIFRPPSEQWEQWPVSVAGFEVKPIVAERYYCESHRVQVITSLECVQPEDGTPARVEYHLSVSAIDVDGSVMRADEQLAQWALRQFGFAGGLQDNHVPSGRVRNYWRPIADPLQGQECPCVDDEPAMIEMQGDYTWRGAR